MTITINIKPEVQAELSRQAAAQGLEVSDYAAGLLEEATHASAAQKRLSRDQLKKTLQDIAQFSHKIPSLPDEAFSRENIYQDHD